MKRQTGKALAIGIGLIALAVFLWARMPVGEAVAVSGCCKQKVGENWRQITETFESCKTLNEADGDNVFAPTGTYWWDASC